MRFDRTDAARSDFKALSEAEKAKFRQAAREFSEAADRFTEDHVAWPKRFRVKDIQGAKGILEMTWSFSGPDGRATWQWTTVEVSKGKKTSRFPAVLWRRIGGHEIFGNP